MQDTTKFEILPNEILIECFEYLNATDIFSSFDFLNYRFYKLIRNIPLHLDAEHIKKSVFIPFCIKLLLNSQIKNQIISLKLSKNDNFDAIQTLFSFLSLNEFSQLRSLTLTNLDGKSIDQISSMLPLLSNLHYFNFTVQSYGVNQIMASLSTCTLQTLIIPHFELDLTLIDRFASLVNLTIFRCTVLELCEFFEYSPNLQYLNIETLYGYDSTVDKLHLINTHAAHLKRLVINDYRSKFDFLEVLLKRTPSLKFLRICVNSNDIQIIDACGWETLITTSLPLLDIFEFKFAHDIEYMDNDFFDLFEQFQSNFWHKQHHWDTELALDKDTALIYTVPYISNGYIVDSYSKRSYDASVNNVNRFRNVTDLTLSIAAITDSCEYHFPNVKSLRLENDGDDGNDARPFLKRKHIESLNIIVNVSNLTHLDISSKCRMKSPSTLLLLLQEIPHISSLKMEKDNLFLMFNNDELCKYLNKMIKKLDVAGTNLSASVNLNEVVTLCQIFSGMQQFRCDVEQAATLELILDELSKLSHMKFFSYRSNTVGRRSRWWKDHVSQLDLYSFTVECETDGYDDDDDYYNFSSDSD